MVFDSYQIDVFFHMRNHYNRLKNVHSVVDCSTPKGLKRSTNLTSPKYDSMDQVHRRSQGLKYPKRSSTNQSTIVRPNTHIHIPRAKSVPNRPTTRRHPEDTPHRPVVDVSPKNKDPNTDMLFKITLQKNDTSQNSLDKTQFRAYTSPYKHNKVATPLLNSGLSQTNKRSKNSHPNNATDNILNMVIVQPTPEKPQVCTDAICHEDKDSLKYNTPISTPISADRDKSPREHEYLQFLLRITEDIIKNDLYTNEEIRKVLVNHINANKERLDLERMLIQIRELMLELNIPIKSDEIIKTQSWTEIEKAMRELLELEKLKPTATGAVTPKTKESVYRSGVSSSNKRCICFDARTLDREAISPTKMPENEVKNLNNERSSSDTKFKCSLDRLTERTEPVSSRATCKSSTICNTSCSTFGAIEVLPGFECLEKCKTSSCILMRDVCKMYTPIRTDRKTMCGGSCIRKKQMLLKKRRKKRKYPYLKRTQQLYKMRHARCFDNNTQTSTEAIKCGTNAGTQYHTTSTKLPRTQRNPKPVIITVNESTDPPAKNCQNDYVFVKGPVYLLKTFLNENSDIVMMVETPPKLGKHTVNADHEPKFDDDQTPASSSNKDKPKTSLQLDEAERNAQKSNTSLQLDKAERNAQKSNTSLHLDKAELNAQKSKSSLQLDEAECNRQKLKTFPLLDEAELNGHNPGQAQQDVCCKNNNTYTNHIEPESTGICKIICPNKSTCKQLKREFADIRQYEKIEENVMDKLLSNDYDLTPQRDDNIISKSDKLIGEEYVVPVLLEEFLVNKEIQTDDVSSDTDITLARASLSINESDEKYIRSYGTDYINGDAKYSMEKESTYNHPSEKINKILTANVLASAKETSDVSVGEIATSKVSANTKITSSLMGRIAHSDLMSANETSDVSVSTDNTSDVTITSLLTSEISKSVDFTNMSPLAVKLDGEKTENHSPIANTLGDSHHTVDTLMSTPTLELTRQLLVQEDNDEYRMHVRTVLPSLIFNDDIGPGSTPDMKDHRRVSILKNPKVQALPTGEKSHSDQFDMKRPAESILKTMDEVIKERPESSKEKVKAMIQDFESLRSSKSGLSSKNTSKVEETQPNERRSFDLNYDNEQTIATELSSSTISAPINEIESEEPVEVSASQIRNVNIVAAKLETFRNSGNSDDDNEVSKTLDQLVGTLREQQEKEEEVETNDEAKELRPITSSDKKSFRCCGFPKRKNKEFDARLRSNVIVPKKGSFSEEGYKHKSQVFEAVISGLDDESKENSIKLRPLSGVELDSDGIKHIEDSRNISMNPVVHSNNKSRIPDDSGRMSDAKMQAELDKISI